MKKRQIKKMLTRVAQYAKVGITDKTEPQNIFNTIPRISKRQFKKFNAGLKTGKKRFLRWLPFKP